MKPSHREVLATSHIAAVAIALLLCWSLGDAISSLAGPFIRTTEFLITAVAILDMPYIPPTLTFADRVILIKTLSNLCAATVSFLAAWFLSRWAYGVGPLSSLAGYCNKIIRSTDA